GTIRRERLYDLDGAMVAFERVRTMSRAGSLAHQATIQCGEILIARNDLVGARTEYARLFRTGPADVRDRAAFRLAEIDYFEAAFDSAAAKLQSLTANVQADLANDALLLLYFIEENRSTAPAALAEFAKSDLLLRQRKESEALRRFEEIRKRHPTALLLDDTMMRIGDLHIRLLQYDNALATFRSVVGDMATSILRDRAQFRIAELYEHQLGNPAKALEAYEQILITFPHSLYVEEARKRIRALRGDAI
ncbi:MAG: tetratricopeptide repeat protein, partial [Bacteroidota bacterium]